MKTFRIALLTCVVLAIANFFSQAVNAHDWALAADRSMAMAFAVGVCASLIYHFQIRQKQPPARATGSQLDPEERVLSDLSPPEQKPTNPLPGMHFDKSGHY